MKRNDEIQAALVAYIKARSAITDELPAGATEVRENEWQGTEFTYPNIRVRLINNYATENGCARSDITLGIDVFTEDASSRVADRIAGIINGVLHQRSFSSNGIQFNLTTTNLVPAFRKDDRTWQSSVLMKGTASG